MKKKTISAVLPLLLLFAPGVQAAERAETARLIREITPPIEIVEEKISEKDRFYSDAFLETSSVKQGDRRGRWDELTILGGYSRRNINSYISVSQLERFDDKDCTGNIGSYITMKDSYAHLEVGFGWMVTYIYKLQTIAEYGHKLYKNLYAQLGYSYRAYGTDDVHIIYPGLIYYFGNSYMSVDFGASPAEGRDTAYFGTLKGSFELTSFLNWWGGIAFGERLYDIYPLDARQEQGYIIFTGLTWTVYKDIKARAGYSYGKEHPNFTKNSINFGLYSKF